MLMLRRLQIPEKIAARNYQVTILGAASETGQTISLLLRAQPSIKRLVLHDNHDNTPGVLLDVSHVPAASTIQGYTGNDTIERALKNSDIVIAAGGVTAKPDLSKKDWWATNTAFIKSAAAKIAKTVPMPIVGIVTEPINSTVPMAAEIMRNHGDYDGKKLFGITTIDLLRTQCLYASENNLNPRNSFVPVIGGHSDKTIIPVLSHANPKIEMSEKSMQDFTTKLRKCESIVTEAKKGWSPTLSVAYGVLVFVRSIVNALDGRPSKVHAYVENNDFGTSFFSGLVSVSQEGAGDMQRYDGLTQYECYLLERAIEHLRKDISKGKKILELA